MIFRTRHQSWSRRPRLSGLLLVLLGYLALGQGVVEASADPSGRVAPLPGEVLRGFQIGEYNWLPGHRGVDLRGDAGEAVKAAAMGTISWIGVIDNIPMVTVTHPDGLRTTYQPVEATVMTGQVVTAGQEIGLLGTGHCPDRACLHWGLRDGDSYLDPLMWLAGYGTGEVRLLPRSAVPRQEPPPDMTASTELLPLTGTLPVSGPLTSGFGSRINPISGAAEFHDGIDIGAACGTAVQVLWPGTVSFAGVAGGYGNRVEIDHGMIGGVHVQTSYSHLEGYGVSVGQQIATGTVIGRVGTTGFSTGCHLHYSGVRDGTMVDPRTIGG